MTRLPVLLSIMVLPLLELWKISRSSLVPNIAFSLSLNLIGLVSADEFSVPFALSTSSVESAATTSIDCVEPVGITILEVALVDSHIIPSGTTRDLGSSSANWRVIYGESTSARYADLAENYAGDAAYEAGTVVVFGGDAEVTTTDTKGDTRVAGVVSTSPAHLMNSTLEAEHVVAVALTGRVPTKVLGRVRKGDILVTSAIPGYAIVDNTPSVGQVIGKALEDKDTDDRGVIEVVVGRV